MNSTYRRAWVLLVFIIAFLAGTAVLMASFWINGSTWAAHKANGHIHSSGQVANAGTIYDSNGTALVKSENGKRVYISDKNVRLSTLHVLGDQLGFIATGIQSVYKAELTGYSFVNGLYTLTHNGEGNSLNLTINAKVCSAAYSALNSNKGTVAVYNYKTGEIVCMVSAPTYDPRNKPNDIDSDTSGKYEGIYINRFYGGVFAPGSTFKLITAACAIENMPDIYERTFTCTGSYNTGEGSVTCNDTHGTLNFRRALAVSCNSVFSQLGTELGKDKLTATAEKAGFGNNYRVGEIKTTKSTFEVKNATKGELGWASIGQYTVLANPAHMLTVMGAVANSGKAVKPFVVSSIVSPSGTTLSRTKTSTLEDSFFTPETAAALKDLMRSNVMTNYGDSRFEGMKLCAKTGTAEVSGAKPHAWFVGFSSNSKFPYAFVVVVQNGGSGSGVAIPVAEKVLGTLWDEVY